MENKASNESASTSTSSSIVKESNKISDQPKGNLIIFIKRNLV